MPRYRQSQRKRHKLCQSIKEREKGKTSLHAESTNSYSFPRFGNMMNGKWAMNRYIYTLFLYFSFCRRWALNLVDCNTIFIFLTLALFSDFDIEQKSRYKSANEPTNASPLSVNLFFLLLNGFFCRKNLMEVWIQNENALCWIHSKGTNMKAQMFVYCLVRGESSFGFNSSRCCCYCCWY